MVITKLYGGLGNQMFQYAAGLVLSRRLDSRLYVDTTWFSEQKPDHITKREFELDIFGIKDENLRMKDIIKLRIRPPTKLSDEFFIYLDKFNKTTGNVLLDGYWQNYKYYENYKKTIADIFTFPENKSKKNREMISRIKECQSVAVHVRRGDYVNVKKTNDFHGIATLEYYKSSITRMGKKVNKPHYFVFSDDLKWCKKTLDFNNETTFVDFNKGKNSFEDMRLMTLCKHNIIANSSFSWWGAWLNQNEEKIVFAPKKWLNDESFNTTELTPPNWELL